MVGAVVAVTTQAGLLATGFQRSVTSAVDPTVTDDAADGYVAGQTSWLNTASGNVFDLIVSTTGAAVWRHRPRVLAQAVGAADHTGNTTQTKVASVLVPAGAMGATGRLEVEVLWSNNNSGNNKIRRVYFSASDDLLGTAYSDVGATTNLASFFHHRVQNLTASTQQGAHALGSTGGPGSFAGAAITSSINTAAAAYVVFSVELANAGDNCGVDHYKVLLTRPDIGP